MFNNKFEVFIDMLLLHSLIKKTSRRYSHFIMLCCMFGIWISIYSVSIGSTNLIYADSISTTKPTTINGLGEILTISSISTSTSSSSSSSTSPNSSSNISTLNSYANDNEGKGELSFGSPYYTSKNSILLNKLDLIADSNSNTSKELQIFYEMGLMDTFDIVHNIGYYIEESKPRTTFNQSIFNTQIKDSKIDETITFAKGTGFYISADSDRVGWNAYDQVYDYSNGITKYLGAIYFTNNEVPGGKLSYLGNKAGIYEYELYPNGTAHRNMWLWPSP